METEASGISIQGVQITIWVPSGNFTEATEAQNGDCRSIQNSQIGSVELSWRKLLQKPRLALLQSGNF